MNLQENEVNTVQVEGMGRKIIQKLNSRRQGSGRNRERKKEVTYVIGKIGRLRLRQALLGNNEHVAPSNTGTTKRNK